MADVVYVHVGAPKTGSTYLQDRLFANRNTLAEHGVHYPVGLRTDMFPAALDLTERPWPGIPEGNEGEWESLVNRVRRADGAAIISHEILSVATRKQVARAMRDLAETEVHIVYAARDVARQIPAQWQESLKHRKRHSFRRYVRQVSESPRRDPTHFFWQAQSLPDVLSRWAQQLPPEHVHVVTVPRTRSDPDELWLRYCRAFAINPAWTPEDAARANESMGIDEAVLLRRLNRRLRGSDVDAVDYGRIVRQVLVHETLAARDGKRRISLPPQLQPWAEEVAEEWVEWIQGAGVDVVGDLDDLRPLPPEGRWQNPDRARQRRLADAGLDALVAAIEESARRPDPDRAPVAKLMRAARRLRRG